MLNVALCRKAAVVSCIFLVGCGSSTPVPPPVSPTDQYAARVDQFYAIDAQNVPANFTPENAMPASGAVTYQGVGFVNYTVNGQRSDLLGDASVRADFGNDAMTGTFNDFVGGPGINTPAEEISAFNGSLAMTGEIGTVAAGCNACFAGQLSGTLTGSGDTVQINSGLLGDFYGASYTSITGFTPNGNTVLVNGVVAQGGATIVAER